MSRPLLLDLFCCEGGAATGYHRAGFDVVGVDLQPQPNYPFPFIQADALHPPVNFAAFDAIHASPPCQAWSVMTPDKTRHPKLIAPTRRLLQDSGLPWVIENVPGSPIRGDFMLCGTMFDLRSSTGLHIQRHRYFEIGRWIPDLFSPQCQHRPGRTMSITGNGTPSGNRETLGRNVTVAEWRDGMEMPWASRHGLAEAIPPAYTEHIGTQLLASLRRDQHATEQGVLVRVTDEPCYDIDQGVVDISDEFVAGGVAVNGDGDGVSHPPHNDLPATKVKDQIMNADTT